MTDTTITKQDLDLILMLRKLTRDCYERAKTNKHYNLTYWRGSMLNWDFKVFCITQLLGTDRWVDISAINAKYPPTCYKTNRDISIYT